MWLILKLATNQPDRLVEIYQWGIKPIRYSCGSSVQNA